VIVRGSLRDLTETQSQVKLIRPVVHQSGRERHLLTPRVGPINNVAQEARANAMALITCLDLDLANFYGIRLIK
jgi:hypothetical protein